MVERFFETNQRNVALDVNQPQIALLSGQRSCGKTSLLFQFLINCASESCRDVIFICSKTKFESNPPFYSQGFDPSSEVLQRIKMKYVEGDEGIKKYFAGFHLHENYPAAIVVDDFGDYFVERNCQERYGNARGKDLAMVRTLAVCYDAVTYANEKLEHNESCKLVLADTHQGDNPRLLFIYKRWTQCILIVEGDGSGSFTLKGSMTSGSKLGKTRSARYSVALQYLVLEEIFDE